MTIVACLSSLHARIIVNFSDFSDILLSNAGEISIFSNKRAQGCFNASWFIQAGKEAGSLFVIFVHFEIFPLQVDYQHFWLCNCSVLLNG